MPNGKADLCQCAKRTTVKAYSAGRVGETQCELKEGSALESQRMRELAGWYRRFAERAGSSVIWESWLLMADALGK